MKDYHAGLIAGAVLVSGGAIGYSLGRLANASNRVMGGGGDDLSAMVMLGGAVLCAWSIFKAVKCNSG